MNCCAEVVMKGMNFYRTRQCKNKATIEVDGKHYCHVHNPNKPPVKPTEKENLQKMFYYNRFRIKQGKCVRC